MPIHPPAETDGALPYGWDPIMLETYLSVEPSRPGDDLRLEARRRVVDRNRIVIGLGTTAHPYVDLSDDAADRRRPIR